MAIYLYELKINKDEIYGNNTLFWPKVRSFLHSLRDGYTLISYPYKNKNKHEQQ